VLGDDAIVGTGEFFGARHSRAPGADFMAPVWRPATTPTSHLGADFLYSASKEISRHAREFRTSSVAERK
jgi:hypothetical protein